MVRASVALETAPTPEIAHDEELERIVAEEELCLGRVREHLERAPRRVPAPAHDYDTELISLRDQIAVARMEDVPPLVEQMERLQSLAARRREVTPSTVDPRSPYFGRLVLSEGGRQREILIGRSTYLDTKSGIRIVDWRDAPISRLYYRYDEGDDYVETFGDREVEGEVETRRSVAIADGVLRRIVSPQGTFVRKKDGGWQRVGAAARLQGGQGTALRAEHHASVTGAYERGRLGGDADATREDKRLEAITALIDPRQFELITQPDSGLCVVQGGAGSGKTTIGLHRLAWLAHLDKRRFRPDRMLALVFNEALARYIARVLPALGVSGVGVRTYEEWASRLRRGELPGLPRRYSTETPPEVTRLKKHPAMLHALRDHVAHVEAGIEARLSTALAGEPSGEAGELLRAAWQKSAGRPTAHRARAVSHWLAGETARALPGGVRTTLEGIAKAAFAGARDVLTAWAEMLSDRALLERALARYPDAPSPTELSRAHAWCADRCIAAVLAEAELTEDDDEPVPDKRRPRHRPPRRDVDRGEDAEERMDHGIDGHALLEPPALDREDDALLLLLCQALRGPLTRGNGQEALVYAHVLVDEAQDLSPVDLAVVMGTV